MILGVIQCDLVTSGYPWYPTLLQVTPMEHRGQGGGTIVSLAISLSKNWEPTIKLVESDINTYFDVVFVSKSVASCSSASQLN